MVAEVMLDECSAAKMCEMQAKFQALCADSTIVMTIWILEVEFVRF